MTIKVTAGRREGSILSNAVRLTVRKSKKSQPPLPVSKNLHNFGFALKATGFQALFIIPILFPMKKIIAALTITLAATVSAFAVQPDWANYGFYRESNNAVKDMPNKGDRVVFFGNSITEYWPSRSPKFWNEHPNFIGRGIGGQTSYNMLSRFREDVVELHPAVVVLSAGTNDVAENSHVYNEDLTFGNIQSMCEIARANGIKVILTSVLPAAQFRWRKEITDAPEKIKALNARIRAYAAETGTPYVDYYSSLLADDGRSLDARYSEDGVHPLQPGYTFMERLVLPAIEGVR